MMGSERDAFRDCGELFGLLQRELNFGELSMRMGNRSGPTGQLFVLFCWVATESGYMYSQQIAVGLKELSDFADIEGFAKNRAQYFRGQLAGKLARDSRPDIASIA